MPDPECPMFENDIWLRFIAFALAVWRVTHLLAREDGPWDVVTRLRRWAGAGFWGQLMDCFHCLSLWIAAPAAFLLAARWQEWPLLWLALSGLACLFERLGTNQLQIEPMENHDELLRTEPSPSGPATIDHP